MQAEPVEIIDTDHEVMSYEALNAELDKIEFRIAQKYQLRGSRRRSIILDKIRRNELLEDELIEQWHALFSSILNLAQDRARESTGPPPNAEPNHSQRPPQAAFFFGTNHVG